MVTGLSRRKVTVMLRVVRAAAVLALPTVAILFVVTNPRQSSAPASTESPDSALPFASTEPDLNWYAPLWERDLRQPPIPPTPTPDPIPQRIPAEAPRLVATFVDARMRLAHLLDRQGRLQFSEVNDDIGGYRVGAIEPGRVELIAGDSKLWIEVPLPKEQR